jgi:uncharacterized protein
MEIRFETTALDRFSLILENDSSNAKECEEPEECPTLQCPREYSALVGLSSALADDDNGNGKECPRECPQIRAYVPTTSCTQTDMAPGIDICIFQHASELYKQMCSNGYYVVCNPTGAGHIVVLDEAAADLLECFRSPTSLAALRMEREISEEARTVVALFSQLGFLENTAQPPVPSQLDNPQTLNAWLHVTNACNLGCNYCYVDKTSESMSDDISRKAIDALFRSAIKHNFKAVQLRYAGGEASLQSERVIALHDYALSVARKHQITFYGSILSNGVFLAGRTIDLFKERQIGVMISLDGVGAYHDCQRPFINGRGSFQFVNRTITRLLEKNLVPHISVTVSQRNLAGLPELITYILERDLPFSLNYYRDNDCSTHIQDLQFTDEQMIAAMRSVFALIEHDLPYRNLLGSLIDKANLKQPHQRACGVGHSYLVIDQKGGIAKCHADIKQTVTTIAADDPLLVIRNDSRGVQGYTVHEKESCRSCSWRNWCSGGCPLLTYRVTGRNDIKSPYCNIYQALFPDVLRLEALRLLKYVLPYPLAQRQPVEKSQNSNLLYV